MSACRGRDAQPWFPPVPDYAQAEAWFADGGFRGEAYDVFYIVPTCVFDWQTVTGDTCHYMDIENPDQRASVDGPIRLAQGIFADQANFFSPYYRQITLESWMESEAVIEARFKTAYDDIQAAFEYYIDHLNGGRPFVLAGHSQGGKAVIELLRREMTDELYRRMIAAYPLGFPIREGDTSPYLIPATAADDTGVFVSFNSASSPEGLPPLLSGSRAAINPLNWRTDDTPGTPAQHLGMVFTAADGSIVSEQAHRLSTRLDPATRTLVVSGVDPDDYYEPALSGLFPVGNYHIVELNFFYRNLQQNVHTRASAYFAAGE